MNPANEVAQTTQTDVAQERRGPRTLAARAQAATSLRERLAVRPPGRMTLLLPDPHSRFAAVELDGEFAVAHTLDRGYGACTYLLAWDVHREPIQAAAMAPYLGGYGDLMLVADLASATPAGAGGDLFVVCDARWADGSPVPVAPRQVLRQQLVAAEELGLVPSVGIEHEVTFLDATGRPLTPHGMDYAVGAVEPLRPLLHAVRLSLEQAGLGVESARGECHPGQYEIVLRHRDALAACDDAMLAQLLVRRAAAAAGVNASYLAAEQTGQGSSCHVHLSLSTVDGEPVDNRDGGQTPSPLLRSFLAGVLAAAGDLTAVFAPTVNSYVRLRRSAFTPRVLRWGVDDRTAAVRLAGRGDSLRLECRFAGADAQPHLVVAAILAAGLAGIRAGAAAPDAGQIVGELATTPWQALARLSTGRAAQLLGDAVVRHQAALLRAELDACCDAVTDWQRRRGVLRS